MRGPTESTATSAPATRPVRRSATRATSSATTLTNPAPHTVGKRTNGPGVRPEQVERPAVQEEQALRPIDPDVPVEVGAAGPEAGDGGVPALVDGERHVEEAQPHEHGEQRDRDDAEREDAAFTPRRIALLVGGYAVGLGGMIAARGLYLTPDRYFLILLVPALALGVARRYVLDFLPFIALIILYEETRGVAHILRPHPYYAPQLDIDRWLTRRPCPRSGCRICCGTVTCPGGRLRSRVLTELHFIVPPTLLFLIWLRRRDLYYRFADDAARCQLRRRDRLRAVARRAALDGARRDGWIPKVHRIGYNERDRGARLDVVVDPPAVRHPQRRPPPCRRCTPPTRCSSCCSASRSAAASGLASIPYALGMWFAIVYFGEHYVSDALIGCAYAAIGYVLIGRWWPRSPLAGPYPAPLARARGAPTEL